MTSEDDALIIEEQLSLLSISILGSNGVRKFERGMIVFVCERIFSFKFETYASFYSEALISDFLFSGC